MYSKVENIKFLKKIESEIYKSLKKNVKFKHKNIQEFFNNFHKYIDKNNLNFLRLNLIENNLSKKNLKIIIIKFVKLMKFIEMNW